MGDFASTSLYVKEKKSVWVQGMSAAWAIYLAGNVARARNRLKPGGIGSLGGGMGLGRERRVGNEGYLENTTNGN